MENGDCKWFYLGALVRGLSKLIYVLGMVTSQAKYTMRFCVFPVLHQCP